MSSEVVIRYRRGDERSRRIAERIKVFTESLGYRVTLEESDELSAKVDGIIFIDVDDYVIYISEKHIRETL